MKGYHFLQDELTTFIILLRIFQKSNTNVLVHCILYKRLFELGTWLGKNLDLDFCNWWTNNSKFSEYHQLLTIESLILWNWHSWFMENCLSHCVLTIYQVAEQRVMVFNATFNNISVISWQSVLLVEETRVPGENHRPVASHWQTLSYNIVSSTPMSRI